jgi:hypothetical protein
MLNHEPDGDAVLEARYTGSPGGPTRGVSPEEADAVVDQAMAGYGDYAIRFPQRLGATPFFRYTPYHNNSGVRVNMWSARSITAKAMPDATLLFSNVNIIRPVEYDDSYPLRMFTTEWVWGHVFRSRAVDVLPVEETPFASGGYGRYVNSDGVGWREVDDAE